MFIFPKIYQHIGHPGVLGAVDYKMAFIRMTFGLTEPERIKTISYSASGGRILVLLYSFLSFSFLLFYNLEFRSYLIGQRLEMPIRSLDDGQIDVWNNHIFHLHRNKDFFKNISSQIDTYTADWLSVLIILQLK